MFVHLPHFLLVTVLACSTTDRQPQTPKAPDQPTLQGGLTTSPQCRQILWRDSNTNRYEYQFDSSQRLSQCTFFEQTNSYRMYAYHQQLTYTKGGLLERVCMTRRIRVYIITAMGS